ncbi:hypothetical protein D3C75_920120 [compost metagenome]
MPVALQRLDDAQLMLGGDPGIYVYIIRYLIEGIVIHPGELGAGKHRSPPLQNAQLMGNRFRSGAMVPGDHHRLDSSPAGEADGIAHLTPRRIDHPGQSGEHQLAFRFLFTACNLT